MGIFSRPVHAACDDYSFQLGQQAATYTYLYTSGGQTQEITANMNYSQGTWSTISIDDEEGPGSSRVVLPHYLHRTQRRCRIVSLRQFERISSDGNDQRGRSILRHRRRITLRATDDPSGHQARPTPIKRRRWHRGHGKL